MFKSILPSRRPPSADFTVITNLVDSKENNPPQAPKQRLKKPSKEVKPADTPVSPHEFEKLLDDLQIPASLRPKLYGMDPSVKAAMLKSSHTMVTTPAPELERLPTPTTPKKVIRRAHSSDSLNTPRVPSLASLAAEEAANDCQYPLGLASHVSAHQSPYLPSPQRKASGHTRGLSFDAQRLFSKSQVNLAASSSNLDLSLGGKITKDKGTALSTNLSPTRWCSLLSSTSSTQLEVEDLKKLRLLLRSGSASWTQEFLRASGYSALLTRLNELLELEWREEQRDDQVLHELLRCFKALSTSSIGCSALRSSCPTPFAQLVSLLYSDKKPGDVATRQLIVELILVLFELYPPSALPATTSSNNSSLLVQSRHREAWESQTSLVTSNLVTLPPPHKSLFSLLRTLLLTPAPRPVEGPEVPVSPHEFIENLHVPRVYKTYLQELSDVCRDYFWVFCHPSNTIWVLKETNETSAEKPRAPGGMTGGVENEAMTYFVSHLKLINSIAKSVESLNMPKENEYSAYRFHTDLFLSGLERIILISRKASTVYYPTLHLELARYINFALRARYELPYTVARLIGLPPPTHAKDPQRAEALLVAAAQDQAGRSTPRHQRPSAPAPALPSPARGSPMRFES